MITAYYCVIKSLTLKKKPNSYVKKMYTTQEEKTFTEISRKVIEDDKIVVAAYK